MHHLCLLSFALCIVAAAAGGQSQTTPPVDRSHSRMGEAFNTGPRQLARLIPDIGTARFQITTNNPQAQLYFDQGLNMVYTFWWYEAERAFRQVVMLDPDCAMGYWGLAYAADEGYLNSFGRGVQFLTQALERAARASGREHGFIQAFAHLQVQGQEEKFFDAMEELIRRYPDDLELKVLYAANLDSRKPGGKKSDALYLEVLAANPRHTGAHHHRIHLWDNLDQWQRAFESCEPLAVNAPNVGHAHHMSAHIYSALGLWNQAAERMDAGARVERRYMYVQGRMPFHTWNYFHNQEYLIHVLGYAGRIHDGLEQVHELAIAPKEGRPYEHVWGENGYLALLVNGERWDDILAENPQTSLLNKRLLTYARARAHLAKGDLVAAQMHLKQLTALMQVDNDSARYGYSGPLYQNELQGLLQARQGDLEGAIVQLEEAQKKLRMDQQDDPSPYGHTIAESIARVYIDHRHYRQARKAAHEALQDRPNNGYALALLIEAQLGEGKVQEALKSYETLKAVWAHADADLPPLLRVRQLLEESGALKHARSWTPTSTPDGHLRRFGPARWKPFPAPDITVWSRDNKPIQLSDYRGRNLILVFYLGGQCLHCLEQLAGLGKMKAQFAQLDASILAVSSDPVSTNRQFLQNNPDYPLQLASDREFKAARAMAAYDEFENLELHATLLIDKQGRVWWYNSGSTPFTYFEHLRYELERMNSFPAASL